MTKPTDAPNDAQIIDPRVEAELGELLNAAVSQEMEAEATARLGGPSRGAAPKETTILKPVALKKETPVQEGSLFSRTELFSGWIEYRRPESGLIAYVDPEVERVMEKQIGDELKSQKTEVLQALMEKLGGPSQEQLLKRIEARAEADLYGFEREVYASYLTLENSWKANAPTKGYPRRVWSMGGVRQQMQDFYVVALAQITQVPAFVQRAAHRYLAWSWLLGDLLFAELLADTLVAGIPDGKALLDLVNTRFALKVEPPVAPNEPAEEPVTDRADTNESP